MLAIYKSTHIYTQLAHDVVVVLLLFSCDLTMVVNVVIAMGGIHCRISHDTMAYSICDFFAHLQAAIQGPWMACKWVWTSNWVQLAIVHKTHNSQVPVHVVHTGRPGHVCARRAHRSTGRSTGHSSGRPGGRPDSVLACCMRRSFALFDFWSLRYLLYLFYLLSLHRMWTCKEQIVKETRLYMLRDSWRKPSCSITFQNVRLPGGKNAYYCKTTNKKVFMPELSTTGMIFY